MTAGLWPERLPLGIRGSLGSRRIPTRLPILLALGAEPSPQLLALRSVSWEPVGIPWAETPGQGRRQPPAPLPSAPLALEMGQGCSWGRRCRPRAAQGRWPLLPMSQPWLSQAGETQRGVAVLQVLLGARDRAALVCGGMAAPTPGSSSCRALACLPLCPSITASQRSLRSGSPGALSQKGNGSRVPKPGRGCDGVGTS